MPSNFVLTNENYHSPEANKVYISVSQYKEFIGTIGRQSCEDRAIAKLNSKWIEEKGTPLIVGGFIDAYFEGTIDNFILENPEIFKKDKTLKSEYIKAYEIIARIERDPYFMQHMSGEKQVIMTFEMFGAQWKIKMDSYHDGICIDDLKIMESLNKQFWTKDYGYMNFVNYWGYDLQLAIYQKGVQIVTGNKLPCFILGASKEKETDIEVIQVEQSKMDEIMYEVEQNTPKILMLKNGEVEPIRCGLCDWCKHTKVLTHPIWSSELLGEI